MPVRQGAPACVLLAVPQHMQRCATSDTTLPDVCTRASFSVPSLMMIVEVLPIIPILAAIRAAWGKRSDLLGHKAR